VAPNGEVGVRDFWTMLCKELSIQSPRWTMPCWIVKAAAAVCEHAARLVGKQQPPTLTKAGVAIFAMDRHHDPAKALRDLGWQARVQLSEGLRRTVRSMTKVDAAPSFRQTPASVGIMQPVCADCR
jgi:nucleoside-diphosphate-sugar epimerase